MDLRNLKKNVKNISIRNTYLLWGFEKYSCQYKELISKDQNDIEFLDFDFKHPELKVESNIKFYFELLDIGEDTFPEIGLFSISPSSIIKNNSQELIISGILSNIEMDTERVDNFSFILKVVSDEINDYFIDKDCFVV